MGSVLSLLPIQGLQKTDTNVGLLSLVGAMGGGGGSLSVGSGGGERSCEPANRTAHAYTHVNESCRKYETLELSYEQLACSSDLLVSRVRDLHTGLRQRFARFKSS